MQASFALLDFDLSPALDMVQSCLFLLVMVHVLVCFVFLFYTDMSLSKHCLFSSRSHIKYMPWIDLFGTVMCPNTYLN